jgi:hypothetical protein
LFSPFNLREDQKLRIIKNRVLRRISESNIDEITRPQKIPKENVPKL